MAHLLERTVQDAAIAYLKKAYKRRKIRGDIYAKAEVNTKKKFGGKRADGLLVYRHFLWGMTVVSLEAKSFKTLPAIKPYLDVRKFLWNCTKFGLMVSLVTGALHAIFKMDDGFWQILIPLWVFVLSALFYGLITFNGSRHKTVDVISQLRQYPGNIQWLAFSVDSLEAMSQKDQWQLELICQYQGVGILTVNKRGKVKTLVDAKYFGRFSGNFLKYYSREKEILKIVNRSKK